MSAVKDLAAAIRPLGRAALKVDAHRWRRGLKDVGDQALMRGLATAFPRVRPGRFPVLLRASALAGHKASDGSSPAAAPPPPVRERWTCRPGVGDRRLILLVAPPVRSTT